MATTAIGGDRGQTGAAGSAIERYPDAVFIRDDTKLFWGNDGDISFRYNSTTGHFLLEGFPGVISDADPLVSDTLFLESDTGSATAYFLKVSSGS